MYEYYCSALPLGSRWVGSGSLSNWMKLLPIYNYVTLPIQYLILHQLLSTNFVQLPEIRSKKYIRQHDIKSCLIIYTAQKIEPIPGTTFPNPPPVSIFFTSSNLEVALPRSPSRLLTGTIFLKLFRYVYGFSLSPISFITDSSCYLICFANIFSPSLKTIFCWPYDILS